MFFPGNVLEGIPAGFGCRPKLGELHEVTAAGEPLESLDGILWDTLAPETLDDLARGHLQAVHAVSVFDVGPDDLRSEDVVFLDLPALHEAGCLEPIERFVRLLVGEARNDHRPARTGLHGPAFDPKPIPEPTDEGQQKDPEQDVN